MLDLPIQQSLIKSQFLNNGKSVNDFGKKKTPEICVTEISFQAQYQAIVMSSY